MTRPITLALVGALSLAGIALSEAPASALPAPAPVAAATAGAVVAEPVYLRGRRFYRRPFFRRGYGYRRPFYRRGLPGHPIRRLLRRL